MEVPSARVKIRPFGAHVKISLWNRVESTKSGKVDKRQGIEKHRMARRLPALLITKIIPPSKGSEKRKFPCAANETDFHLLSSALELLGSAP